MSYKLRVITGPTVEPVALDDVKLHAHIDSDVEDDIITSWIKAGRIAAENFQWRAYYTQKLELIFDEYPPKIFELPRSPLISVESVKYYDTDNTEYEFDLNDLIIDTGSCPGRISLAYNETWPTTTLRPIDGFKVRYFAGYGDSEDTTTTDDGTVSAIPESVKSAIYIYCTWHNENRAGETPIPSAFYDLLRPDKVY